MKLLNQKMDDLGLIISLKKLKAITKLNFLIILSQLEFYIDLINYIRRYMPYYITIIEPLKKRKAILNQKFKAKNQKFKQST